LRLKALNELFGSVVVTESMKTYYTIRHGEKGLAVRPSRTVLTQSREVEIMPYFESYSKAKAYLELLNPMLTEYHQLAEELNFLELAQLKGVKVIHK
jgi:hypothetical protein